MIVKRLIVADMDSMGLAEMLKNKNREAISKVYDQYAPALNGLILRIVKSPAKAELVLERTFLRILEDIHTYNKITTLFTWMSWIARTTALENSVINVPQTSNKKVNNILEYERCEKDCMGLIEGMQLPSMKVFCHCYFQCHTLLKTSHALGISLENVKTHLRSALGYIKNKIRPETEI